MNPMPRLAGIAGLFLLTSPASYSQETPPPPPRRPEAEQPGRPPESRPQDAPKPRRPEADSPGKPPEADAMAQMRQSVERIRGEIEQLHRAGRHDEAARKMQEMLGTWDKMRRGFEEQGPRGPQPPKPEAPTKQPAPPKHPELPPGHPPVPGMNPMMMQQMQMQMQMRQQVMEHRLKMRQMMFDQRMKQMAHGPKPHPGSVPAPGCPHCGRGAEKHQPPMAGHPRPPHHPDPHSPQHADGDRDRDREAHPRDGHHGPATDRPREGHHHGDDHEDGDEKLQNRVEKLERSLDEVSGQLREILKLLESKND